MLEDEPEGHLRPRYRYPNTAKLFCSLGGLTELDHSCTDSVLRESWQVHTSIALPRCVRYPSGFLHGGLWQWIMLLIIPNMLYYELL